jgi:hypothetical protein
MDAQLHVAEQGPERRVGLDQLPGGLEPVAQRNSWLADRASGRVALAVARQGSLRPVRAHIRAYGSSAGRFATPKGSPWLSVRVPWTCGSNLDVFGVFPSVGSAGRRLAVGWSTGARTVGSGGGSIPFGLGLSPAPVATFPAAPPEIPYGGFSPVRLEVPGTAQFSGESSPRGGRLKCDPHMHRPRESWLSPSGSLRPNRSPASVCGPTALDDPTWTQRSSLRWVSHRPTLIAWRPHPPVWSPPGHFPARPVRGMVFDIQGSSCPVTRPSELSLPGSPGLPPSTSAGSSDTGTAPSFRAGTGHRVEGRHSWHLRCSA